MKRIMRLLLIVGVLAGGVFLCSPSAPAGPFGRGPWRRGWGGYYGPGWGYRVYRPYGYGYGWGGYGMRYPVVGGYGWGYPASGWGYRAYGINNPALGVFGVGYPAYGLGGYPGFYGTSASFGAPMGGFFMSSYPY